MAGRSWSRGLVVWEEMWVKVWMIGVRVCWRRGRGGGGGMGHGGGRLVRVWVGKVCWVRKLSSVVWWLVGSVGWSVVLVWRLGCAVGSWW